MSKTIHVYACTHVEVEEADWEDHEYVFVHGPCSYPSCADTDPTWFAEQGPSAPTEAPELRQYLASRLQHNKAWVDTVLTTFNSLGPLFDEEIEAVVSDPETLNIFRPLDAETRLSEADKLLNFAATEALLKYARDFERMNVRPVFFFDFCLREARAYIEQANDNLHSLHRAVDELVKRQSSFHGATDLSYDWPNSHQDYEPEFGKDEIKLLRLSPEGIRLLQKPLTAELLKRAQVLIDRNKKQIGLLPSFPANLKASCR